MTYPCVPHAGRKTPGLTPVISVCVVTRGRTELLEACLRSLEDQLSPPEFELLVCSNEDAGVAASVFGRFPDAQVGEVTRTFPGVARNLLVQRARGDILLFIDDDVILDRALLRRLADTAAAHPDVDVFGGPNLTPPGSSDFQILQGAVLASAITSGPVHRRYGAAPAVRADEQDLILCNLAVRRHVMLPFADDLRAGEESAVLVQMTRRGVSMRYDPELVVYHERRPTFRGFARQMIKYGEGRGLVLIRRPRAFRFGYLIPVALIGYLALLPALVLQSRWWLSLLLIYAAVVAAGAAAVAVGLRRPGRLLPAAALISATHLLYGVGILAGVLSRRRPGAPAQPRWVGASREALETPAAPH
ncbi:MAG: glycosyltransferase [Candidatus Dormibacteria bacterium]